MPVEPTTEARVRQAVEQLVSWERSADNAWECDAIIGAGLLRVLCHLVSKAPEKQVESFLEWCAE